jgi:hypothetical protein
MPRHTQQPTETLPLKSELVASLKDELLNPQSIGQPIILEDSTPQTISVRVIVVWDRWHDLPGEIRSDIIRNAYVKAAVPKEFIDSMTFTLGVTVPEAAVMGLVPFAVVPAGKKDEQISNEQYRCAMIEAGASILENDDKPQLRCATLDDAENTLEYLENILPDSRWIITKELDSSSGH